MTTALLPGWDSLDRVTSLRDAFEIAGIIWLGLGVAFEFIALFAEENRKARRRLEIVGIFCFAALGVCEYLQYRYGHRTDFLAGLQQKKVEHDLQVAQNAQATLQTQLSSSQAQLQTVQTDLSTVEQKQKPRTLTPDEQRTLIQALSPLHGQPAEVVGMTGDVESIRFAKQLAETIAKAGWAVRSFEGISSPTFSGIQLVGRDPSHRHSAAVGLESALKLAGLSVQLVYNPANSPDYVSLRVGQKP